MTDIEKQKELLRDLRARRIFWVNEIEKRRIAIKIAETRVADLDKTIEKLIDSEQGGKE